MFKKKQFEMPDGVNLDKEGEAGLKALASHIDKYMQDFSEGNLTAENLGEKLKDLGIDKDQVSKLEGVLKSQGDILTSLKENATTKLNGLKGLFFDNFDNLQAAVKNKNTNFSIKAEPDVIDQALIHLTTNTVTSTTGVSPVEQNGVDSTLYMKRRPRQFIKDIASVTTVASVPETFTFEEEGSEQGYIAVVAENGLKPQVHLSLIKNKVEAQKAAGFIVVTEEMMKWRTRAWAAIQRLFRTKVDRDYENLLTTSLLTNTVSYVGTPLDGTIVNPTDFHAIVAAILQGEQLEFNFDTLVLNPSDKWALALTQTPNGAAFILPYIQEGGQFGILGLRIITSNKVSPGEFLIGESGTWLVEEETPTLRTGLVNDDLIHNRMTIVAELFFLSYVPSVHAGAWVKGNFADIKEALTKAAGDAKNAA